jgi:hypothetical protein
LHKSSHVTDFLGHHLDGDGARGHGASHEPLPQLEDVVVELNHLLPLVLGQVDPTQFKVKHEQSCHMLVYLCGRYLVSPLHHRPQCLVQLLVCVQSGIDVLKLVLRQKKASVK